MNSAVQGTGRTPGLWTVLVGRGETKQLVGCRDNSPGGRILQQTSTHCDAGEGSLVATSGGHDDDLHVAAEGVQEPKQPVDRETLELATDQGRDFGLVHAEDGGGPI